MHACSPMLPCTSFLTHAAMHVLYSYFTHAAMHAYTESRIPYEIIYYCYVLPRGPQAEIGFMVRSRSSCHQIRNHALALECWAGRIQPSSFPSLLGSPLQVALLLIGLPLLFTLLCDAADIFICPTMALLSQSIPGLKPRVAGGRGAGEKGGRRWGDGVAGGIEIRDRVAGGRELVWQAGWCSAWEK